MSIEQEISVLSSAAQCDGDLDKREYDYIMNLGQAHGMERERIQEIIDSRQELNLDNLSDDEKFEILYNIVIIMKVDGKVYNEEILFCQNIASRLGYEYEAIMELYPHVHARVKVAGMKKQLQRKVEKFLK